MQFYGLPEDHPDSSNFVACFKPRLSAQVAGKLNENLRRRFCSPIQNFVREQVLEQALKTSRVAAEIKTVKVTRPEDNRQGEFYLLATDPLSEQPNFRHRLVLIE